MVLTGRAGLVALICVLPVGLSPWPAQTFVVLLVLLAAAIVVASQAPAEVKELFRTSASDAFMQGMHLGCFVCAGVALCGSIAPA